MKFKIFSIPVFLCWVITAYSQTENYTEQAAKAFEAKDYQQAITLYEQQLNEGLESEDLYYNLANSYFKNDELGKAILNYERALLLDANDKDVKHNLAIARQQLVDDVSSIPPFFLKQWWISARQLASSSLWAWLGLILFWTGVAGLIVWQMGKERSQKKKGFLYGLTLICISILPLALAWSSHAHRLNSEQGIILSKEVVLRSGPDKLSQEIVVLHEGTKVDLLDLIDTWYKVRLANGEKGWLAAGTFEEI